MKKIKLILSLILLIVFTISGNLIAQIATPPASGDGISDNPYQIATLIPEMALFAL